MFFDGTLGDGGHAEAILEAAGLDARLAGTDRDADAVERVRARLARFGERVCLKHANFERMREAMVEAGFAGVDGLLLDIGYSSVQMDESGRGFSFSEDGPLDMRMDRSEQVTAEMIVNGYDEKELADMIYEYGEERASRRIARAIVNRRKVQPFSGTLDLADVVGRAAGGRRGRIHPATRTFQALRIAVNRELECLQEGLRQGVEMLNPGGRMAVISFHSLEDRIVKYFFRDRVQGDDAVLRLVTRKPLIASEEEVRNNPRSRSAKLRVIERKEE